MVNPFSIDQVAWYGAVLATFTLLFNLWRFTRERPRLQIQISTATYDDGGASKIEKTESGESIISIEYFHVEVANIGERSTTLMGVAATSGTRGISGIGFTSHYGHTFPHVLKPGEVWSCRVKKEQVLKLQQKNMPRLELHAVHWQEPLLIPFPTSRERVVKTK
jgi:hypothetical protein